MTTLSMIKDINGQNTFGLNFSNTKKQALLTADVESTLTVPVSSNSDFPYILAVFSPNPGASVWVALNETAEVPVSGTFSDSSSENNPAPRVVEAGDVLHFITSNATVELGVTFYAFN